MTIVLIVLVIFVALNIGRLVYQNNTVPSLGVENGLLKPLSKKPNNVSTQAEDPEKLVSTLAFKNSTASTITALKKALTNYGDNEIKTEEVDYLYVVFSTEKVKFHDDAEFWLDEANQVVHFRSASRAGYSDLGLNKTRYESLTELYNAQ